MYSSEGIFSLSCFCFCHILMLLPVQAVLVPPPPMVTIPSASIMHKVKLKKRCRHCYFAVKV